MVDTCRQKSKCSALFLTWLFFNAWEQFSMERLGFPGANFVGFCNDHWKVKQVLAEEPTRVEEQMRSGAAGGTLRLPGRLCSCRPEWSKTANDLRGETGGAHPSLKTHHAILTFVMVLSALFHRRRSRRTNNRRRSHSHPRSVQSTVTSTAALTASWAAMAVNIKVELLPASSFLAALKIRGPGGRPAAFSLCFPLVPSFQDKCATKQHRFSNLSAPFLYSRADRTTEKWLSDFMSAFPRAHGRRTKSPPGGKWLDNNQEETFLKKRRGSGFTEQMSNSNFSDVFVICSNGGDFKSYILLCVSLWKRHLLHSKNSL